MPNMKPKNGFLPAFRSNLDQLIQCLEELYLELRGELQIGQTCFAGYYVQGVNTGK